MTEQHVSNRTPGYFLLAVAVALAGWFIGGGVAKFRTGDRYVTVKGVAEREVEADLALWPLAYVATDDDLSRAQAAVERSRRTVLRFLAANGVDTASVELQGLDVTDRLANPYQPMQGGQRFIVAQRLMVRSTSPATIQASHQKIGELLASGVVLSAGPGFPEPGPSYLFTKLNDHKPEMIADATARAREAAEQFARDAKSSLGGIRQASQGVFVVLPRDQAPGVQEERQRHKTLRVVTTVEYFLK